MKRSRLFAAGVALAALVVAACSSGCPDQQPFNSQELNRGPLKG